MPASTPSPASRPSNRFRSRSSLASATALAAVAAPSLAQAQIIWSGVLDQTVNAGSPQALLDLNGNSTPDANKAYAIYHVPPDDGKSVPGLGIAFITGTKTDPSVAFLLQSTSTPVSFGNLIDSSLSYQGEIGFADCVPPNGTPYYYAFTYQVAGDPHYGWAQLSFASDSTSGILHQWAYNSISGDAITAGQTTVIPEPAAFTALLGLTAFGIVALRRKPRSPGR